MPPRLFNNGAGEGFDITTAADMRGAKWPFGTVAIIMKHNNVTGDQCYGATTEGGGVEFGWFNNAGTNQQWWRSGVGSNAAVSTTNNTPYVMAWSKATGSVAPRHMLFNMTGTAAPTFTTGDTALADYAAQVSIFIGAEDASGGNKFRGEIWDMAYWDSYAMSDREMQRLIYCAGQWGRLNPSAWINYTDGREQGDMFHTTGVYYQIRQTSRTLTSRGTSREPPGYRIPRVMRRR